MVISRLLFSSKPLLDVLFVFAWIILVQYAMFRLCHRGDGLLVIRMLSFFFAGAATLAIVLLYYA